MTEALIDKVGGEQAVHALAEAFYDKVLADPLLIPLFDDPEQDHAGRLAWWFIELLGGAAHHSKQRGGFGVVVKSHEGRKITPEQLDRWLTYMLETCAEQNWPDDVMALFAPYLQRSARAAAIHSNYT
jgi:hemoglobin